MITYDYLVKIRQEELLREAERSRALSILKTHRASSSKPGARLLYWLGGNLHRWGRRLEIRFAADIQPNQDQPVDHSLNV